MQILMAGVDPTGHYTPPDGAAQSGTSLRSGPLPHVYRIAPTADLSQADREVSEDGAKLSLVPDGYAEACHKATSQQHTLNVWKGETCMMPFSHSCSVSLVTEPIGTR